MNPLALPLREYPADRLDLEFSPAAWHPDREVTLARHIRHGAEVAERLRPLKDVRYGGGPLQTMDIFPAAKKGAPLCIAFHGGFWRTSDKRAFLFLGEQLAKADVGYFVVNFDMCPAIDIDGIVRQVQESVVWIRNHAREYGCDPDRIYLFGHATGSHLAACLLAADWSEYSGFNPRSLSGAILISGLYDLRQIPQLRVNETLKLTAEAAARNSPLFAAQRIAPPIIISVAANETPEFIAQTQDMAIAAVKAGVPTDFRIVQDCGHFDILDTLLDDDSVLFENFLALMR